MRLHRRFHEAVDQRPGAAMIAFFIQGKRLGRITTLPLLLEEEDRQRAKQRQVLRGTGLPGAATIFILSAISAVVLAILDTPVVASRLEDFLRGKFIRPQAREQKADVVAFFIRPSLAKVLGVSFHLQDLGCPGQPQRFRIGQLMGDPIGREPAVPIVHLRPQRGKNCP